MDCGVGSIVWVRRRNGSWWPGQILGPDDLSVSHLTSPRSGTPVKLLGREDASVQVPIFTCFPFCYVLPSFSVLFSNSVVRFYDVLTSSGSCNLSIVS